MTDGNLDVSAELTEAVRKNMSPEALNTHPALTATSTHLAPAVPAPSDPAVPSARPVEYFFPSPTTLPTQVAFEGIRFDFNQGMRISVPAGEWNVRLWDMDSGNLLYETKAGGTTVASRKQHFLNGRIEVRRDDELVFDHNYSAAGKHVAIHLPVGTLGDSLGWFPYAARFQEVHGCILTVTMAAPLIALFQDANPHINCMTPQDFEAIRDQFYASYCIGLFFHDEDNTWQPADFRLVGLHRTAAYILGVDPDEERPRIAIADGDTRPIEEPYVVVATQSSSQCKYWNNPFGWRHIIANLRKRGYRVVCIDQKPVHGAGLVWNHLPHGVEDETGNRPLQERARWLKHADFFVGLSSGLSWLAWASGTPVVLISGFTHPVNEFHTPYRVFNTHVCNSCWHDIRHPFDHTDFMFCPRHKDTPRQFECTRMISPEHVLKSIDRIPNVKAI